MSNTGKNKIAVLIPCYNEGVTIHNVVMSFKNTLPDADIYVYDNNSTDNTVEMARKAGAIVRNESQQGKGHVIRRMFREIDSNFYILVDGDGTYDNKISKKMLEEAVENGYDLVNCIRVETESSSYREGHRLGNKTLTGVIRFIFGNRVKDMLSGYKLLSRRFVKSFPVISNGFDVETEITVHAMELSMPIHHVTGDYKGRPAGSESKLSTYKDGFKILMMIFKLIKHERPLIFFGVISALFMIVSVLLFIPIGITYLNLGVVPKIPTLILSISLAQVSVLSFFAGIILATVSKGRKETKLLTYLNNRS